MAVLKKLPSLAIINGFKGTVDFYFYRSSTDPAVGARLVPCARSWPRSPSRPRAQAVQEQWLPFSWASANWNSLSARVQSAYRQTASEATMSGRDWFVKSFISDYFREGQWD